MSQPTAPTRGPTTQEIQAWVQRRSRFRARIRFVFVSLAVVVIGIVATGWTLFHDQLMTISELQSQGFVVDWNLDFSTFRKGGETTVNFVPRWNGLRQQPSPTYLGMLPRLRHLTELDISGFETVVDEDLGFLMELTDLTDLQINRLPNSQDPTVVRPRLTDRVLDFVQGLTHLKGLGLAESKITDAGLTKLANLKELETLDLDGTLITDRGLDALKGLTKLKFLRVERTRVTRQGVADFQTALPNVEVTREPYPSTSRDQ